MRLLYVRKLRQEEGAMLRRLWVHFLTCCLLPEVVRYGKLLLDTDRSRSRLLSPSSSFSLPLSPNQGNGRQEGMEVTEPDGETSAGSSNRSSLDALEKSSYALIKTYAHFSSLSRAVVFKTDVRFTSLKTFSPPPPILVSPHLLPTDVLLRFSLLLLLRDLRRPLKEILNKL